MCVIFSLLTSLTVRTNARPGHLALYATDLDGSKRARGVVPDDVGLLGSLKCATSVAVGGAIGG